MTCVDSMRNHAAIVHPAAVELSQKDAACGSIRGFGALHRAERQAKGIRPSGQDDDTSRRDARAFYENAIREVSALVPTQII
jgi:hypothetical protein